MYHRILVPIDGSGTADRGLREAIGLAAIQNSRLKILHVVDGPLPVVSKVPAGANPEDSLPAAELLVQAQVAAAQAGVAADAAARGRGEQRLADVIVDEACLHDCDLIVMGTHGRHGVIRLAAGSAAEEVVRISPVPVLLVRHPEDGAVAP